MNKEFVLSQIDTTKSYILNQIKYQVSEPSIFDNVMAILNELQDKTQKFKEEKAEILNELSKRASHYNMRVVRNYDQACSIKFSKSYHAFDVLNCLLDTNTIELLKERSLNTINKALLKYQIASSETRTPSLYSEPLQNLATMKDLLVAEKWPEPTFPETTALTTFIHHNKTELSKSLIDATEKAVKNFDEYYDYLDPSYRQSN